MRLIDADAFMRRLREASEDEDEATRELAAEIHDLVEIEATFYPVDAKPVVRCKDCRWGRETCGNIECWDYAADCNEYHGYEWFCPNGERREE